MNQNAMTLSDAWNICNQLQDCISVKIFGRNNDGGKYSVSTIELLLIALFSGGHLLLEDYPGTGKSYMSKTLGESIENDVHHDEEAVEIRGYQRIQCTPDLLPSDITGYMILEDGRMIFRRGPIFANILLADEINRTPPKVQSAMLEAMAEKQVTVDDRTYQLGDVFFVIATQNPLDRKGTYELPYAQLDRFLFKRILGPLDNESIKNILSADEARINKGKLDKIPVTAIVNARNTVLKEVKTYNKDSHQDIKDILLLLREAFDRRCKGKLSEHERWQHLKMGSQPSARCLEAFLKALKVQAFIRFFKEKEENPSTAQPYPVVGVKDIRLLACDLLRHRVIPLQELSPEKVDELILESVRESIEEYTRKTSPSRPSRINNK